MHRDLALSLLHTWPSGPVPAAEPPTCSPETPTQMICSQHMTTHLVHRISVSPQPGLHSPARILSKIPETRREMPPTPQCSETLQAWQPHSYRGKRSPSPHQKFLTAINISSSIWILQRLSSPYRQERFIEGISLQNGQFNTILHYSQALTFISDSQGIWHPIWNLFPPRPLFLSIATSWEKKLNSDSHIQRC